MVRLTEQLKSLHSQLDTVNDEKQHLQERSNIILEQTKRDLAVKHAECQEYKAKVDIYCLKIVHLLLRHKAARLKINTRCV